MNEPWQKMLHLGDPAFTATVLVNEARRRGYDWTVLQWATTEQYSSRISTLVHKAVRGVAWEANFARHRIRHPLIHLHSSLALPHVSWALRTYALHLHGTDIRTQQYKPEFRERVLTAIRDASVVYYSTPDIREHTLPHRPDAILAPVPVTASSTPLGAAPADLQTADYIFFTSRWEEVKGGQFQIDLVRALKAQVGDSIRIVGLDWGPNADQARDAGVHLIPKQQYPDYLAIIAGARVAIGQQSGVMSASELDALDLNVPLVSPLNPDWYDGSSPSLVDPPVLGRSVAVDDADGLARTVAETLNSEHLPDTHSWVQQHHSPGATLVVVLRGYEHYL
ncbi:MAG: glycosyltransferase family 4 protein [Trueperella sp.]|nr:glycosyltransferase family 4 protein [Trueperella sp.]